MMTLYFSGTGNTKFVAELFSRKMDAKCFSIEDDVDFSAEIKANDTIAFCYPVYNSRVPRIMRIFAHKHMTELKGKKVIIFATQQKFSGDGARVFSDLFKDETIEVIYAEHFNMQQNMGNIPVWWTLFKPTEKSNRRFIKKTTAKIDVICDNIKNGIVKKRGFSAFSKLLGLIQGVPWQKNTKGINMPRGLEKKVLLGIRIHDECTACGLCTKICPMKNLEKREGKIHHAGNCTVCYRCVNHCPQRAITVYIHLKPRWQFNGPL
jgi:ferredoxin/flavodoxin